MIKILYIYGFGGGPEKSKTVRMLREALDPDLYETICREYCQSDCPAGIKDLHRIIGEEHPDIIIAASLGAFFALNLDTGIPRIIINPCMEPCKAAVRAGIAEQVCRSFAEYERNIWNIRPEGPVYGYFGLRDELFGQRYKEAFRKHFGPVYDLDCAHHINDTALKEITAAVRRHTPGLSAGNLVYLQD